MKIIVMGAGVIGVTTAWYLNKSGHEVTVIDRQPEAALETSCQNGGQISVCHAMPWATPYTPALLLPWLLRHDSPLLVRLALDHRIKWMARFLYECLPSRTIYNLGQIINLARYSRDKLAELRLETGLNADFVERGILHIYSSKTIFRRAIRQASLMQDLGVNRQVKTPAECLTIEPALAHFQKHLIGGTYTPADLSGDAQKFTQGLARICAEQGVRFYYNTSISALLTEANRITGIVCSENAPARTLTLKAQAYVAAMGSYTPLLLRPLGIKLPIIPIAGYSASIPVDKHHTPPLTSLIQDEFRLVFSRYPNILRIAGLVELNGYQTTLDPKRYRILINHAQTMFPNGGYYEQARFWKGLRPTEPGNNPAHLGHTRYSNLFNNSGHGTLGWTMACGSGQAIADLVNNKSPEPDFRFVPPH
ncbi:MAG: D-amino acid dehydrogenase [Pseudomonadota bacterium]|nr:D-amino acid dehydrogenase [Pseudomonadota bacterium]